MFFMNYVCSFHPSDARTHLPDPFLREVLDIPKNEKYVNTCYSFTNYTPNMSYNIKQELWILKSTDSYSRAII